MKTTLRLVCCGIAAVLLLTVVLVSCTTETYDKGDGAYSMLEAQMANIHVDQDLRADYLTTDDGERLTITEPFVSNWMKTPDSVYRAMTYFMRVNKGIQVTTLNRVAVTVPKEIKDLKTDPVRFESAWTNASGTYINLSVYLMLGATNDTTAIQTLGCHRDTLRINDDGTKTRLLTLYHDQGGVPEYYSQRTFISIPVAGITGDSISLTINTYNGVVRKTFARKN